MGSILKPNIHVCARCSHFDSGGTKMKVYYCGLPIHGGVVASAEAGVFKYHWTFKLPKSCPYELEHLLKPDEGREDYGI